jgi:hypothetical protein
LPNDDIGGGLTQLAYGCRHIRHSVYKANSGPLKRACRILIATATEAWRAA